MFMLYTRFGRLCWLLPGRIRGSLSPSLLAFMQLVCGEPIIGVGGSHEELIEGTP
jgi:hypothetical protein